MTSGHLHIQNGSPPVQMEVGNSNQLLSKGNKKKRWLVVAAVAVLVGLAAGAAVLLRGRRPPEPGPFSYRLRGRPAVTLEQVIKGQLNPVRFNGTWISDEEIFYRGDDGSYKIYNVKKGYAKVILAPTSELKDIESTENINQMDKTCFDCGGKKLQHKKNIFHIIKNAFQYELSADRRYLMLAHNYQKLYRHTFLAYYHIIDLETKKSWPLTDVNGSQMLLQLVVWSPVGNAFAYVYVNDIYYRTSAREQPIQEYRLTHNGRPGTIYNGVPDWVYEEEILSSNTALWFSKDGRNLAFATFNDSQTPVMNIPYYGAPGDMRYQYTQAVNIRYPKPGRPNPTVSLNLINLIELQYQKGVTTLDIPASPGLKEPVLYMVTWTPTSELFIVWMNRVQNEAHAILCSTENTKCRLILDLEESAGWISLPEPLFSADGQKMVYIYSHDQGGDIGSFRHVTVMDVSRPETRIALTSGKYVVTELQAWDEEAHYIYFMANVEGSPGQLKLHRVYDRVIGAPHTAECMSCLYQPECAYNAVLFSKKSSYYTHTCGGPSIPVISVFSREGKKLINWEKNHKLETRLSGKVLPTIEYLTVPVAEGMSAYVKLYLPPDLDLSGDTKYPMIVQVYAGPDSNLIHERFSVEWHTYLTVNQSIIYAMIDARGSGLKGDKILFSNYRNLGTKEIQDQIEVTKWLQRNKSYIDGSKTAIWGWSYGGYATGMVLANDTENVFKCGISVAPVSDWLLYDTLYTERYMGLPTLSDNIKGYEAASLNNKVLNFRNKKFLLIHGTLDDNVHYQQSMMLAKALELNDILFDQQSYPDEGHGLSDVRPHLYHSLGHFIYKCFHE